jgi:hypothetical protein
MIKSKCPECRQILGKTARECLCGWRQQIIVKADRQCNYTHQQRRCPLPGRICPYPYGNGPWYCSRHWQTLNDPRRAEAMLIEIELEEYNYERSI